MQHWARQHGIRAYETTVLDREGLKDPFCYIAWRMSNPHAGLWDGRVWNVWVEVGGCGMCGWRWEGVECVGGGGREMWWVAG